MQQTPEAKAARVAHYVANKPELLAAQKAYRQGLPEDVLKERKQRDYRENSAAYVNLYKGNKLIFTEPFTWMPKL